MSLAIEQYFLSGRFHATRWNQNPFEDPHGEWPPSPWRLLRTLAARWFEYERETGDHDVGLRDKLLQRLAENPPAFHLPENAAPSHAWPSRGIKQYQPTALVQSDKGKGAAWLKRPQTTLVVDTFISIPPNAPVIWMWAGLDLPPGSKEALLLDQLLRRVTYFGRAESLSILRRTAESIPIPRINCVLEADTYGESPVLVVAPGRPLDIKILLTGTDEKALKGRRIPPGTVWWYGARPSRKSIVPNPRTVSRKPVTLMQFAVGGRVLPKPESWIRVIEVFRGRVLKALAEKLMPEVNAKFADLPEADRVRYSLISGKDENKKALTGHRHAYFWLLPGKEEKPPCLICYRKEPFDEAEQDALLFASEKPLAWNFNNPAWQLRLVPLPGEISRNEDCLATASKWSSVTLYVPSRHIHGRNGQPRPGRSLTEQIQHELAQQGFPEATITVSESKTRNWLKVHRPHREKGEPTNDVKLGYDVTLEFAVPVTGPICLGHSSHFGLGLFCPVSEKT